MLGRKEPQKMLINKKEVKEFLFAERYENEPRYSDYGEYEEALEGE